ncbi:hypothetical protein Tco_0945345, partial [Tanacetum coccineum]
IILDLLPFEKQGILLWSRLAVNGDDILYQYNGYDDDVSNHSDVENATHIRLDGVVQNSPM